MITPATARAMTNEGLLDVLIEEEGGGYGSTLGACILYDEAIRRIESTNIPEGMVLVNRKDAEALSYHKSVTFAELETARNNIRAALTATDPT